MESKEVKQTRYKICPECDGEGQTHRMPAHVYDSYASNLEYSAGRSEECQWCNGSGKIEIKELTP